jgi:REP element-mobilizing transposase RayT
VLWWGRDLILSVSSTIDVLLKAHQVLRILLSLVTSYINLKRYWGQHLWARGYWVASSRNVTDKVWKEYIETQKPPEPDDNFNVV